MLLEWDRNPISFTNAQGKGDTTGMRGMRAEFECVCVTQIHVIFHEIIHTHSIHMKLLLA